jgi:DNA helicase HerA-like ATPase
MHYEEKLVRETGIYKFNGNQTILKDIESFLKQGKTVVIDSSLFTGTEEILVATIIVEHLFREYRHLKFAGTLAANPVISIVLEEAPRVIGKNVLEARDNIFGTIAREGRKFNMGLIAITQLPSIISREILANMNTKIILGNEMGPERIAIIESAAQDLSDDYQNIGSLDKGEAIITSNFTKFAIPIKIPLFSDLVKKDVSKRKSIQNIKTKSPF